MRDERIKIAGNTFLFYLFVLVFSGLILRINWMLTVPKIVEGVLSLAVVLVFVSLKPVYEYLSKVPPLHLRLFLGFVFLLVSSHFIEKEKTTFPFLTWGMYSGAYSKPQVIFYEYSGIRPDGVRVNIVPEAVFPVIKHSRLNEKLEFLLEIYTAPEKNEDSRPQIKPRGLKKISFAVHSFFKHDTFNHKKAEETIDALVLAIGREYNVKHKSNPVTAIEIIENNRDLEIKPGMETIKKMIRRVVINGE